MTSSRCEFPPALDRISQIAQSFRERMSVPEKIQALKSLHIAFRDPSEPLFQGSNEPLHYLVSDRLADRAKQEGVDEIGLQEALYAVLKAEYYEELAMNEVANLDLVIREINTSVAQTVDTGKMSLQENAEFILGKLKDHEEVKNAVLIALKKNHSELVTDAEQTTVISAPVQQIAQRVLYRLSLRKGLGEAVYQTLMRHSKAVDFIASPSVQSVLDDVLRGFNSAPADAQADLKKFIERQAVRQHFDNPEQYVSHGFDHSLNVLKYVDDAVNENPDILRTIRDKYELSPNEAALVVQLVAVFHDFGYPDVGKLGKAYHAVTGAEVASSPEFLSLFQRCLRMDDARFQVIANDLKNAVLFHSADKVEIFRDAKIIVGHGEFIIDAENIVHVYNSFSHLEKSGKSVVVCSEEAEQEIKNELLKAGMDEAVFQFHRVTPSGLQSRKAFKGRGVDMVKKGDAVLGIEYKEVDVQDDPFSYLIRLADNCDMTPERFSELQRTRAFRAMYHLMGPEQGQLPATGALLQNLELARKGKVAMGSILTNPRYSFALGDLSFTSALDKYSVTEPSGKVLVDVIGLHEDRYKNVLVQQVLGDPRYQAEIQAHGKGRLHSLGMAQDSVAFQHFGGCESVRKVRLMDGGGTLRITVEAEMFHKLNETLVTENGYDDLGKKHVSVVGVGEYQIWRACEAYKSLRAKGKAICIRVEDEHGNVLIPDFERYSSMEDGSGIRTALRPSFPGEPLSVDRTVPEDLPPDVDEGEDIIEIFDGIDEGADIKIVEGEGYPSDEIDEGAWTKILEDEGYPSGEPEYSSMTEMPQEESSPALPPKPKNGKRSWFDRLFRRQPSQMHVTFDLSDEALRKSLEKGGK